MRRAVELRRLARVAAVAAGIAGVCALAWLAPRGLRHVDAFRVRKVEVIGARYMEPYAVVRAAGLDSTSSVFDDADAWRTGVLGLPLAAGVRVHRRLPGTVVLEVREVEPVALVAGNELRAVDADGRALALDPAGAPMDLPILSGATLTGGRVAGDTASGAVAALAWLEHRAPDLAERVSMVEIQPAALRVLFRSERAEALLPLAPSQTQLNQLRLACADLTARGELRGVRRIDVRFRDQVVVSFLSTPMS